MIAFLKKRAKMSFLLLLKVLRFYWLLLNVWHFSRTKISYEAVKWRNISIYFHFKSKIIKYLTSNILSKINISLNSSNKNFSSYIK
ncbi:unnamed protein product [Blepharisma stoltei]|uniref:Uncharacterized protein n=1 Tax=Blepharisma stoltei TaxID=1481888 RepID=A0AAU9K6H1_9CILI|nr:unnamed protein product [Blepharisma stoltei]